MDKPVIHQLLCECLSPHHRIMFIYWPDEDEVYVTVNLHTGNLWHRIKTAIKYIFGKTSPYGEFDEIILRKSDYEKVFDIAKHLKNYNEEKDEEN